MSSKIRGKEVFYQVKSGAIWAEVDSQILEILDRRFWLSSCLDATQNLLSESYNLKPIQMGP